MPKLAANAPADAGEHRDHVMMITQVDLPRKVIYVYEAGSLACCEVNNNLRGDIVKAAVYSFEQLKAQKFKLCKPKNLREGLEHTGNTCDSLQDPSRFSVTDWADVKGTMTWVAKKGMWQATQCHAELNGPAIKPGELMTVWWHAAVPAMSRQGRWPVSGLRPLRSRLVVGGPRG